MSETRNGCRLVAERAASVRLVQAAIPAYAAGLPAPLDTAEVQAPGGGSAEHRAAFCLTLDAINFGSGWFPTLRKRAGVSGYFTVAGGVRRRLASLGPWRADELAAIDAAELADVLHQDPAHELMGLFATSLRDLGAHVAEDHAGSFAAVAEAAHGSVLSGVSRLAGWECFRDVSTYGELRIPFLKRAQITIADLARAGVGSFRDLERLTMFADNLVPHVLRLDGILEYDPRLLERIERGELIEHGSRQEVEIRACALHAVELIVAARRDTCAAQIDQVLWQRGQRPGYKAHPRHRTRCRAY